MTIFVNSDTRVIVQGMTGAEGRKHTQRMLSAGTAIVGGTNPRKAGTTVAHGDVTLPVFGTVKEAIAETQALTRSYARRQVSWFKRYPGIVWVGPDTDPAALIDGAV